MRTLALALLLTIPAAAAHADPVQEARSATAACLAAVIDNAPVEDIDGDDVTIRRGRDPVSCTVRVSAGEPVQIQDAVQSAIKRRAELFVPAKTKWQAGDWAFRETFCNIPGRRALSAFVSTNRPGYQPVLTVTVFEAAKRDERCDRDLGVQQVAAAEPPAPAAAPVETAAAASTAAPVIELPPPAAKKKKQSFLRRIPGLGRPD
ncbi:MAG: hypothetical protein EPO51_21525 [Phenylobacterium sp.]|uniref:hypothetical protein n=1 Tax=Phenylobacterium sp. TaxID=1871053 RepID=UPI00120680E4|nr:hypothetical protein [Phenylobacterium sp.]TAJ69681.1 MAG: hypothetical protein EPO51_21525 [Phenylobacterium sp.]